MSNKNTTNEATDVKKVIIVEGSVRSAYIGTTRFNDIIKNRISIYSDSIPYDDIIAFNSSGSRLTPSWLKDKNGYINASSKYDIPVKDTRGREITFEDWVNNYQALGSKVKMSFTQSEGAIYPKAIKILEDGEKRDAFEDL